MAEYRPISIVTSKAAQRHLDDIKVQHADILKGISEQSQRIQQSNQQRKTEQDNKQASDREYSIKQQEIASKNYERTN